MTDDPKSKRRGPLGPIVAVVVLLVVYPLSYGSAFWLFSNDYISGSVLNTVYAPIDWLAEKWDWFSGLRVWYIFQWVPLRQPP